MSDARSDLLAAIRRGERRGWQQQEGGRRGRWVPNAAAVVAKYLLV